MSSARCGSPRPRCRTCGPSAAGTSSRCPPSAASPRSRWSACYHASKWALEGFSQSLAQEVAPFGVHVTLIEPGGFSTDWAGSSARHAAPLAGLRRGPSGRTTRPGSSAAPSPAIPRPRPEAVLKIVDAENPPLRVFFGELPLQLAKADYESRLATWEQWQPGIGPGTGLNFPRRDRVCRGGRSAYR